MPFLYFFRKCSPFQVPKLDFDHKDKDQIIEVHMRGSGPGGQSVAKSNNAVSLKHIPTGIVAKCHETRSVNQNRLIARQKLLEALDKFYNKEDSVESQVQVDSMNLLNFVHIVYSEMSHLSFLNSLFLFLSYFREYCHR